MPTYVFWIIAAIAVIVIVVMYLMSNKKKGGELTKKPEMEPAGKAGPGPSEGPTEPPTGGAGA